MTKNLSRLLLHVFPSFGVGGSQVRFSRLATGLSPKYRHLIVALNGNYGCRSRIPQNSPVMYLDGWTPTGWVFAKVVRFRSILRELQPDVLVTYNWGAIEWALANALPLARHIHVEDGFGPEERHVRLRRRSLARRFLLRSSVVVVPSRKLQRIALEEWGLKPSRVHYIPNGIDCDQLSLLDADCSTEVLTREVPVIGTVAALRPEKNIERLVRAFSLVVASDDCRLIIVGDGPERGHLEALSRELGLSHRVRFRGHTDAPESAYRDFDVFALSSDTEEMPFSVLEAMAAGLPIAATDVGDVAEMVAPSNRRYVAGHCEKELAASLNALLASATERERIGRDNQDKTQECFRQDVMLQAYARLFDA